MHVEKEQNVWATEGSQDHGHTRQGSVLTHQCLGQGTNVERAEESFPDG
jgi:hypothetical protein